MKFGHPLLRCANSRPKLIFSLPFLRASIVTLTNLREIIADILGVPSTEIHPNSGPSTFPQWDSVAHINIILSVEAQYGVSFSPEEMVEALSVEEIAGALRKKGVRLE
jgi:acyl carrier protein